MTRSLVGFVLFLTCFSVACEGPFGLASGGGIEGTVAAVPDDWSFVGASGTAQLETRPEAPYSVNLAYTLLDGALYLNAGDTRTQWVENMLQDPRVRLRIRGVIYEMHADRVTEADETTRFAKAWTGQSIFRRDPAGLEEAFIYRLRAR